MKTIEDVIKDLENKAFACTMTNKESRARKGAYVDAIVMLKELIKSKNKTK